MDHPPTPHFADAPEERDETPDTAADQNLIARLLRNPGIDWMPAEVAR
jgi:hypothetical protein